MGATPDQWLEGMRQTAARDAEGPRGVPVVVYTGCDPVIGLCSFSWFPGALWSYAFRVTTAWGFAQGVHPVTGRAEVVLANPFKRVLTAAEALAAAQGGGFGFTRPGAGERVG